MNVLIIVAAIGLSRWDEVHSSAASNDDIRAALKPFNALVGEWKGTATPQDRAALRRREFSREESSWAWNFTSGTTCLKWKIDNDKPLKGGTLTYLPNQKKFELALHREHLPPVKLLGEFVNNKLELEGRDEKGQGVRLALSIANDNRFNYRYAVQAKDGAPFVAVVDTGNTRKGVNFAAKSTGPTCIVTGGHGTMTVEHKGKTYYVCCSGCKEAFDAEPEKYLAEAKNKSAKK